MPADPGLSLPTLLGEAGAATVTVRLDRFGIAAAHRHAGMPDPTDSTGLLVSPPTWTGPGTMSARLVPGVAIREKGENRPSRERFNPGAQVSEANQAAIGRKRAIGSAPHGPAPPA